MEDGSAMIALVQPLHQHVLVKRRRREIFAVAEEWLMGKRSARRSDSARVRSAPKGRAR